jgi:hypothetical protein
MVFTAFFLVFSPLFWFEYLGKILMVSGTLGLKSSRPMVKYGFLYLSHIALATHSISLDQLEDVFLYFKGMSS